MTKKFCVLLFFLLAFFFFTPKINSALAQCFTGSSPTCPYPYYHFCVNGSTYCSAPAPTPTPTPTPTACVPTYSLFCNACSQSCGGGTQQCLTNCYTWQTLPCYNSPACPTPTPASCPQITCGGNSGAGGSCNYPNSPNVNVGSCTYTCTYPFGPSSYVAGYTISVCQSNNCYANSCQCYPSNPCPPCPTITCGTNSGAGGTCNYGSSTNQNISGCTATCPNGTQVAGYSISACQSNGCYYNTCQCYPNAGACNTGYTKTTQTCNAQGTGYNTSSTCVLNCTSATPAPTPTPYCTTNLSCDPNKCGVQCGNGTMPCQYTGPAPCTLTNAPSQPCNKNCPNGQNCDYTKNTCNLNNTITGNVFVDTNSDGSQDNGELNYTGTITITSSNGASVTYSGGSYTVNNLIPGTYTISYTNGPPSGYRITYIVNGPPPSFTVSVGASSCSVGTYKNAACDANGNISNLNFGITNFNPWIQCIGADCRIDSGFTSKIPAGTTCGAYANLPGSGGTPGLVFTGNSTPDFGQGQASQNPYNWVVGGLSYGETYSPTKIGGQIKTSYNYLSAKATQGNITPIDLASYCSGGIGNCTLSGSLPHGIYKADGNLKLVGGGYTFGSSQNFIILVNGDLTIAEKIFVPVGSTVIFSTGGNITVDKSVGEATSTSTTSDIEGIYSADKSFTVQGTNNCAQASDIRLNVAGTVITNAGQAGGQFSNERDMCASNSCPAFSVKDRPDFILNTPSFLKQANFTYQEVAP